MIQNNIEELLHIYNETLYETSHLSIVERQMPDNERVKSLILLNEAITSNEVEQMLTNMLKACKLGLSDYKLEVTTANAILESINYYQPETILLFGLMLESESFTIRKDKYQPFKFAGKKILMADSLPSIFANQVLKSVLWTNGLKPLFNID